MMRVRRLVCLLCALPPVLHAQRASKQAPSTAPPPGPTHQELIAPRRNAENWLLVDNDYAGRRFSPSTQITPLNVRRVGPVCHIDLGVTPPFQSNPIVYNGIVYITTTSSTIAFRGHNCEQVWRRDWTPKDSVNYPQQRGVALKDGVLVRGTADGYLLALSASDGGVLWERQIAEAASGAAITMPLTPFRDVVLAGVAGSEFGARGWIGAFNLKTGEQVWRFNTVPAPNETPAAATWGNQDAVAGGGVWTAVTLDPVRGEVYVPVGSAAPPFNDDARPGTNLYTSSMVVLNARTGKLLWYRQQVPHDIRNWDVTHAGPLYDARVGGQTRRLAAIVGKAGVLESIDRSTRRVVFATPIVARDTMAAAVSPNDKRVCPGPYGGVSYNGPAYSPRTNSLYVPTIEWCAIIRKEPGAAIVPRRFNWGGRFELDPVERARGWLVAVDASTGKVNWRYASRRPMVSAVTVTAGEVVFAGELTGDLIALDARTGAPLFRYALNAPLSGGIVTYELGQRQYVAVVSGTAGAFWGVPGGPSRVTLFALP
jgi:alcohol dehydrogenase (cytochrome c)